MSVVTDVIITALESREIEDPGHPIHKINAYLMNCEKGQLAQVDQNAGGYKAMQCEVFLGAFNYLNVDGFKNAVKQARWDSPENFQLFLKLEDDEVFTVFFLKDL